MVNTDYVAWRAAWNAYMPLLIFILIFRIVREAKHLLVVLVAVYLSMSGEALLAWYERLQGAGRATAHLADPNRAGTYYAMALPFFVTLFLTRPGRIRWLYLAICVIQVGAIFATLSRGAMLAGGMATILVVAIFFAMSRGKSGGKMLLIVAVVLLANTWQLLVPQSVEERVLFTIGGKENIGKEVDEEEMDGAAKGRLHLWREARELAWERPWGYGAYTSLTEMQTKLGYVKATHNMYLSMVLDMGIQGLVALLIFVAAVYRRLWNMYRHAASDMIRDLGLGLMGSLTAGLVAVFFQDTLFRIEVSGQFWLLMAAGLAVQRQAMVVRRAPKSTTEAAPAWQPASPRAAG